MRPTRTHKQEEQYRLILMISLLMAGGLLTYYFHVRLGSGTVFTHFFYIPIILGALWWKRKGLFIAFLLGVLLILSHNFLREDVSTFNDYFRITTFFIVGAIVVYLREKIGKIEDELKNHRDHLEELVKERTNELERTIQDLRLAEENLRESEARYRAIVQDQTELICRHLVDGTITFVNDAFCRYFGKKKDDLIGQNFMHLLPDDEGEKLKKHLLQFSPENLVCVFEHQRTMPSGKICWQKWTSRMLLDDRAQTIECQSVGRDITERKKAEELIKESSEKIKLFAYSVSHDLKNPAISAYGLTRLLHDNYKDSLDERGQNYCHHILKSVEQSAGLVEQINVYMSTKETSLKIESVKLKELFQELREEFSIQLQTRKIDWSESELAPEIKADRSALSRVLRNLIDNALKYGGEKLGKIRIGYEQSDEFHIISVTDNGAGIRVGDTEKIFGIFQRLETSQGIEGTGLGLAIVKEIAEQHGGKLWLDSSLEQGTTFCVSISRSL